MPTDFSNPRALRSNQYKTDKNLNARIALHECFSTNPGSWHRWVFKHLALEGAKSLLEIGCGPGNLWAENTDRLPHGAVIVLSDFSPGMLEVARSKLDGHPQFRFACWDARFPALSSNSFDRVIADHMLYHVPDIHAALAQAARVLHPDGLFCATTNGETHLHEIWNWVFEALPGRSDVLDVFEKIYSFSVENGLSLLSPHFASVEYHTRPDGLEINEVQPLLDFVASSSMMAGITQPELDILKEFLAAKLAQEKTLRVTKDSGLFVASQPL